MLCLTRAMQRRVNASSTSIEYNRLGLTQANEAGGKSRPQARAEATMGEWAGNVFTK